jgi:hypothetical protein
VSHVGASRGKLGDHPPRREISNIWVVRCNAGITDPDRPWTGKGAVKRTTPISDFADAELLATVEGVQLRAIKDAGFDPATFSERTDAVERTFGRRMYLRGVSAWLRLTGRSREADLVKDALAFGASTARHTARLPIVLRDVAARMPGTILRYQRNDDHYMLEEMRQILVSALSTLPAGDPARGLLETLDATQLATAPIGRCNAIIQANRAGDRFAIILDDEVGRVASQMGLLFASLVKRSGKQMTLDSRHAVAQLAAGTRAQQVYRTMVEAFVEYGSTTLAAGLPPRGRFDIDVMSTFAQLGLIFVLAHELAHAHLGHLSARRGPAAMIVDDEETMAEEESFAQAAELEADALAKRIAQCVCRFWDVDPGLVGPAALMILQLYGSAYDQVAAQAARPANAEQRAAAVRAAFSHPTPEDRLARLLSTDVPAEVWAIHVAQHLRAAGRETERRPLHKRWRKLDAALARAA